MKTLVLLFIVLLSVNSFASFKVISIENTSNEVNLNGKYAPVIMAGISGRSFCEKQTTTTNSCAVSNNRSACNLKTVCPTTKLKFTITADSTGELVLTDASNFPIHKFGSYTAGTTMVAEVPWAKVCSAVSGDSLCSMVGRAALKIGVSGDNDLSFKDGMTFISQVSGIADNLYDPDLKITESLSDERDGIKDYTLLPGNEKALLAEFSVVDDLYLGEAGRIVGLRAFFTPANCSASQAVTNSSDSYLLNLDSSYNIIDNQILGLKNGVKYLVMLGVQDEAGNIGYFKDFKASCVESQHTVTPHN